MIEPASDAFLESYEWRKLRMQALTKHGARCQCCGKDAKMPGVVINVDHIKPRRTHPHLALDIDNLQVLCHDCNHGKGNWDTTDWRAKGGGYFFNPQSGRRLAHLWTGSDTACRMWSSGGMSNARTWQVHESAKGKRICNQCRNNIGKS